MAKAKAKKESSKKILRNTLLLKVPKEESGLTFDVEIYPEVIKIGCVAGRYELFEKQLERITIRNNVHKEWPKYMKILDENAHLMTEAQKELGIIK